MLGEFAPSQVGKGGGCSRFEVWKDERGCLLLGRNPLKDPREAQREEPSLGRPHRGRVLVRRLAYQTRGRETASGAGNLGLPESSYIEKHDDSATPRPISQGRLSVLSRYYQRRPHVVHVSCSVAANSPSYPHPRA